MGTDYGMFLQSKSLYLVQWPNSVSSTTYQDDAAIITGADIDIIVRIYNSQGQLLSTVDDPSSLQVTTSMGAGQYYVSVSATPNPYASTYGMRGKYTISLN